ncbi:amidohydrolase family protein [Paraflavisolibacter sp. H34]|uniref:amidohydrolase family protein n=1 Tax=Huijunlia imazamoxiresistens TaxID=3127457 RepID=UPI003019BCE3
MLITDEGGTVLDCVAREAAGDGIEPLQGILAPGLVNCHCHLELSHMKDVLPRHTGLVDFLIGVVTRREAQRPEVIRERIAAAEKEMAEAGTVGVVDICNTDHALAVKAQSALKWHSLVEVLNLFDHTLPEKLRHYQAILDSYQAQEATASLTPHAPYSISMATYAALDARTAGGIIAIHNQETEAENELFRTGTGDFLRLFAALGLKHVPFAASGKTSLQTYLPYITGGQTLLLVHNTYTTTEDLLFARAHAQKHGLRLVYCLCPNANRYIENKLPPVELLVEQGAEIVLGTDSYSSNQQLSIAAEVATLQQHFPHLPLETLLQWATSNGASALGWGELGAFRKGTRPGIVLLDTVSGSDKRLTGTSKRIL